MSSARRRGNRLRQLSFRLTLWHSLIVLGSGLALLGLTNVLLRNRAYATEKDAIESRVAQYASEYNSGGLPGVMRLAALRKGRAQKAFFVRVGDNSNKTTFLRDPDDWAEFEPDQLSTQAIAADAKRVWQTLRSPSGIDLLIATSRMSDGGILQVGKSNEDVRALLSDYLNTAWWIILAFVPVSFAGGAFLASRALRPVQDLTGVARSIIETNRFDARVPARGSGDELNALVHVFNEMLGRIDTLVREMRESIDNVAHDLRTPLMRLSQKAQNLIEANHSRSVATHCPNCEAAVEALGDCVEEADRVTAMLNTLMDIAETEAGLVRLNAEAVPLRDLVQRTVEAYAEFAEERGIRVTFSIPSFLRVHADPTAISRVLANLLDNAIKYTPSGGTARITARRSGEEARISVSDTGVGISPDDLPRIWERLFRGDRSRSERGLGLGLSFVRAIVEAHGGTATANSLPSRGTEVIITLPLVSQQTPAVAVA
jgi:signal transduction histidine kinase